LLECPLQAAAAEWFHAFQQAEQQLKQLLNNSASIPLEAQIINKVVQQLDAGSRLFCSNSMVIRDCDSFIGAQSQALTLTANRGASGIDGNLSTLLGMAAADEKTCVGLLGDLALYHDMNGLLAVRHVKAILVVFNNGGGAIFSYLPQAKLPQFEQYWLTDTQLDLAIVAQLYQLNFKQVKTAGEFEQAFWAALKTHGSSLIEVSIERQDSVARHQDFWSQCAQLSL